MNKTAIIYTFLVLAIIAGCYFSFISINALVTGNYISIWNFSETCVAIILLSSLLISMLSVSAIIYKIRKTK